MLQKILSQDQQIYPHKKVTGYYGDLTYEAVLKFQKKYNVPQTGVVNELTRNKLNELLLRFLCPEPSKIYPDLSLRKIKKNKGLPLDYIPTNLVPVPAKIKSLYTNCLKEEIIPYLQKMFLDAKKDGVNLIVISGFRLPEIQEYLYNNLNKSKNNLNSIAKPGFSEHQLGTTIDIGDAFIGIKSIDKNFDKTKAGQWLIKMLINMDLL